MAISFTDPSQKEWINTSPHRSSKIETIQLVKRDAVIGGFEFQLTRFSGEEMISPRHRHNFEQIKIALEGRTRYGDQVAGPRVVSYFPAGTRYGPQSVDSSSIQAILQYDGLGLRAHASQARLMDAMQELNKIGKFENGIFHPFDGSPKRDGGEAVFSHATGQQIVYPPERYFDPVYMRVDGFPFIAVDDSVRLRKLGVFAWPETSLEVMYIPSGKIAEIRSFDGPVIAFVLSGELETDLALLPRWSAVLLEETDSLRVSGGQAEAEVVLIRLPDFREARAEDFTANLVREPVPM